MKKSHSEEQELTSDEIRSEFQLERMVLFSDAVFAIVITLMAIDIKIKETVLPIKTNAAFLIELKHLRPLFMAYVISFVFIGVIWSRHLKLFSRLKDYDGGLIVRNLVLLFFIGLFPFGASVIFRFKELNMSWMIYISLVLFTLLAQQALHYYIYIQRPNLRRNISVKKEVLQIKIFNVTLAGFFISLGAVIAIPYLPIDQNLTSTVLAVGIGITAICTRIARSHYLKKLPIS